MVPLDPRLHQALEQNEYLRLDNVLLARRAAQMERQLELALRPSPGFFGALLGGSDEPQQEAATTALLDVKAEVDARLDENAQLQHAFLEQRQDHQRQTDALMAQHAAGTLLLRDSLREAEVEAAMAAAAAATSAREQKAECDQHCAKVEALNSVCLKLQHKCASALDELEATNRAAARLRQRDAEHQEWRDKVKRAFKREQQQQREELARLQQQVSALQRERDELDALDELKRLRAALHAERAERLVAEERAKATADELALSAVRFQQQIATLSDALSEMHAKEDARQKKLEQLREQKRRQHDQQKGGGQSSAVLPPPSSASTATLSSSSGATSTARTAEPQHEIPAGRAGGMLGGLKSWGATAVEGLTGKL